MTSVCNDGGLWSHYCEKNGKQHMTVCTSCDMLFLGPTRVFLRWHLDQFSRFCMALQCDQHTDRQSHRPPSSDQQEISNNLGRGCVALPSVTLRRPSPQKCPSHGEVVSLFTTSYLRRNRPTTPNGISIDSAVFAKYTFVTSGQTDRQTVRTRHSACTNSCCASSTVTDRQYGHGTQPVPIAVALALPSTLPRG